MQRHDIRELAEYAILRPEILGAAYFMPDRLAYERIQEKKAELDKAGRSTEYQAYYREEMGIRLFGTLAYILTTRYMTGMQFRRMVKFIEKEPVGDRIAYVYLELSDLIPNILIKDGSIDKAFVKDIIDYCEPSLIKRFMYKFKIHRLHDEDVSDLKKKFIESKLNKFYKEFGIDSDDNRFRAPASYNEALKVDGCTAELAELAACIKDMPDVVQRYYRIVLCAGSLEDDVRGTIPTDGGPAMTVLMLCEGVIRKDTGIREIVKILLEYRETEGYSKEEKIGFLKRKAAELGIEENATNHKGEVYDYEAALATLAYRGLE